MIKLSEAAVGEEDKVFCDRVILARVTDSVPTPVERDIQGAVFQLHKVQAIPDPVTAKELQWSALKASVVGTYYDARNENGDPVAAFGNDVDTFFAPHAYAVFVPGPEDLSALVNSFVSGADPLEIGRLRYTETPRPGASEDEIVPVKVDPRDFVGHEYGNRTALFGKTRMGKSNTIKVIADTILSSDLDVGQVIFDPSGEYTYYNSQDKTSLYMLHPEKCVRYSIAPRLPEKEREANFSRPKMLRINFFDNVALGHSLIRSLYDVEHSSRPDYMLPVLGWEPVDPDEAETLIPDFAERARYYRTLGLYYAILIRASYAHPRGKTVEVPLRDPVKQQLAQDTAVRSIANITQNADGDDVIAKYQPLEALPVIYERLWPIWNANRTDTRMFPPSSTTGGPYLDDTQQSMLRILGDRQISGPTKIRPFLKYHDLKGSNIVNEIVAHVEKGKTVLIDYANISEEIHKYFSEIISRNILGRQMELFAENQLGDRFVVFYFEEAHELFRADDKDLNNVYNKLAKEGAKFNIGMVYATQSMTTLSPDLLKNTENFFIAHLDDDREVKEVTRKYAFRDVAEDVQRTMSKGFVRMITQSHRFALPVQIRKFEPRGAATAPGDSTDGAAG